MNVTGTQDPWTTTIDKFNAMGDSRAPVGSPQFYDQLQILNIHLLFCKAVIVDIFRTPASVLKVDNSVFSVRSIKAGTADDASITNTLSAANTKIQDVMSKLSTTALDSYTQAAPQYNTYLKGILDDILAQIRPQQSSPSMAVLTNYINTKRKALFDMGFQYNQAFKLKTVYI